MLHLCKQWTNTYLLFQDRLCVMLFCRQKSLLRQWLLCEQKLDFMLFLYLTDFSDPISPHFLDSNVWTDIQNSSFLSVTHAHQCNDISLYSFHLGVFSLVSCKGYYPVFQNTWKVKWICSSSGMLIGVGLHSALTPTVLLYEGHWKLILLLIMVI